ncbi:hypothetical protein ACQP2U_43995 (plasmid) [Nocardia sp. CA-084685]|uniref:hypothetical protein n=1 Tax=Nocardia sp. CA-084685 TaxID=3239970 RepID=UPI003D98F574
MSVIYRTGDYYGDGTSNHIWEITDAKGVAAELYVCTDRSEIANIEVRKDRRGEGLARALYEAAVAQMPIYHAPVAHRTEEGNAFAQAVGGETVPAYDCDCYACNIEEI